MNDEPNDTSTGIRARIIAWKRWCEDLGPRTFNQTYGRFLAWCYPDLKRLKPEDRIAAVWVASTPVKPSRLHSLLGCAFVLMITAVPLAVFFGWMLIAPRPRTVFDLVLPVLASGLAATVTAATILFIAARFDRTRLRRVLRDLDIAICPHCGYDLTGHPGALKQCPECGRAS